MAENRVSITINAKNEAGPAINQAKQDIDDLGVSAGKTGATVGKTSKDIDGFGKSATGAGSATGKAGRDVDGFGKSATGAGSATGKASRDVDGFGRSAGSASQATKNLDGSLSSTMSTALRFAGVIASGLIFNSAIQSAYSYNRTLEDTQLGLASLAYATMQFSDAQGKVLTGQAAFNESLQFSSQFQDKLRLAGLQTAATFEQLSNAVTQAWTPAVQAGFNPDQIISFTSATTQAATAMGINLNQMGEEIRSVLTGTMTSMNTRLMPLMQSVGLTNEKLKELAKTGELYPAVMKAFEGATLAAEKANVSLGVSFSNLQDAGQSILGIGLKPFFDQLGASARDLTGHIFTVHNGTIQWNQSLLTLMETIGQTMGAAVKWTYEHAMATAEWIKVNEELVRVIGAISLAIAGLVALDAFLGFIWSAVEAVGALITVCAGVVEVLGGWVVTAIVAVAAALAGWMIYPLIKDIELFGHTIETWVSLVDIKVQEMTAAVVEWLTQAFYYTPQEYFGKFIVLVADCLDSVVEFFTDGQMLSSILSFYKRIYWDQPLEDAGRFLSWLSGWFGSFGSVWSGGFQSIVSAAITWFAELFIKKIPEMLVGFAVKLGEWFGKIVDFFKNFSLSTAIDDIRNWGKSLVDSATQGAKATGDYLAMENKALDGIRKGILATEESKNAVVRAAKEKEQAEVDSRTRSVKEQQRLHKELADAVAKSAKDKETAETNYHTKTIAAATDNSKKMAKMQNEQQKLHEKMWKAQTATVEDHAEKQLEIVKHQYEENVKAAKGNSQLLLEAERTYQAQLASIRQKEKDEEEKKLQAIADKHREYRQIIEKNEAQSLDNRLAANQKWYSDELRELDAWAEKHKVTGRELEALHDELAKARAIKEDEIRKDAAEKEEKAIQEKVKAWDKAYEKIQETLTGFLENGKLDLDSFAKAFKNMAANLVSSWMVNMARMSLPAWLGGTAGLSSVSFLTGGTAMAGTVGSSGYTDRWMPGSASSGTASGTDSFTLAGLFSSMSNMTGSFGNFLSGGWAQQFGGFLSNNGAGEVGGWLTQAGTSGFLSGPLGAGLSAGVGSALLTGLTSGDWQKAAISGIGSGAGAAIGTMIGSALDLATPGIGTAIGAVVGNVASSFIGGGSKYDDADFYMSFGNPERSINEYDSYVGNPAKALYSWYGDDRIPNAGARNSAVIDHAFMLDIQQDKSGLDAQAVINAENAIADYFRTVFSSIDEAFAVSVGNVIRDSKLGLGVHIEGFENYAKSGDIAGMLSQVTAELFDTYGNLISETIFNTKDTRGLFSSAALESLKRESETLGETFIRVAELLKAVPEGISRIRTLMQQGMTEADAFSKLEGQYSFVSGVLGNALSAAMKKGVESADFDSFSETFTVSLRSQLQAAVASAFQGQIFQDVINSSFGSLAGFSDMVKDLTAGKITIAEFKSYMQTGMAAASAAIEATKPIMQDLWNIMDLVPAATELEQARTFAGNVVSGAITEAMKQGVEAASWDVFRNNIQSQLSAQLQTIVLNAFTSNMISSIMSSVFADGGGLGQLVTDFMNGKTSADQFSSTLGAVSDKIKTASDVFGPMFNTIMDAFNIQAKNTSAVATDLVKQSDEVSAAVDKFKTNSADASLMLEFMDALVVKIPALADDYALLDAALIKHREGIEEYGSSLGELTGSFSKYTSEIKDLANNLASAAGEAAQRALDAAKSASEAAKAAADSARSAGENKDLLLAINRNTKDTASALDRLNPDGDALQVRVAS